MKNDLDPILIDSSVTLQIFKRVKSGSKELVVEESLEKFVGTLIGYGVNSRSNSFVFKGVLQPVLVDLETHYFEIFPNDNRRTVPQRLFANVTTQTVFPDVVLVSQIDAEKILDELRKIINLEGSATLADLYDLAGMPARFTDTKWGWKSINSATIVDDERGFRLKLPRTVNL